MLPMLEEHLSDPDETVRRYALKYYLKVGGPEPQRVLLAAIADPEQYVRASAFLELEDHLAPEMLPMLEEHLSDPDETVRRYALKYCHAIGEESQTPPSIDPTDSQGMTGLMLFDQWPMFSFWEKARREAISRLDEGAPPDQRLESVLLIVHLWSHQCELGSEMYDDMLVKGPTPEILAAKRWLDAWQLDAQKGLRGFIDEKKALVLRLGEDVAQEIADTRVSPKVVALRDEADGGRAAGDEA
jgi:hypothetical protein